MVLAVLLLFGGVAFFLGSGALVTSVADTLLQQKDLTPYRARLNFVAPWMIQMGQKEKWEFLKAYADFKQFSQTASGQDRGAFFYLQSLKVTASAYGKTDEGKENILVKKFFDDVAFFEMQNFAAIPQQLLDEQQKYRNEEQMRIYGEMGQTGTKGKAGP